MTAATMRPVGSTGGRHADGSGYGLVFFAAILLLVTGFFNMIYGIAAIANSHVFVAGAHYVIGDLRAWGWVTLILSVLLLAAAGGGYVSPRCRSTSTSRRYGPARRFPNESPGCRTSCAAKLRALHVPKVRRPAVTNRSERTSNEIP